MKARREARIKRETVLTPEKVLSNQYTTSDDRSNTPIKVTESLTSPTRTSFSPSISRHGSNRKTSTSTSSDVDFSPATGAFDLSSRAHPVPCSNDNGRTFDWSSAHSDDGDKRWSISIGKKREKDKLPPLGALMDEQEQSHRCWSSCVNCQFNADDIDFQQNLQNLGGPLHPKPFEKPILSAAN